MNKLFLLLSFCFVFLSSAQIKNYEKAVKTFEMGNLKGANKLIDKCILHEETKDNPNVYLLKSKIMFAISKDYSISEKFPNAAKDAMKFAEKSLSINKNESAVNTFRAANIEYFTVLVKANNKEAMEAYNTKKYAKALPLFKRSMTFGLDTQSLVYAADCYWQMDDRIESIPLFKKAADMIYAAVTENNSNIMGYHKEPFRKLCLFYIDYKAYDSAYIVVKNGREILPNDPMLNEYTYQLMRYTLDKILPSEDYLFMVQNSLKDFPSDSFLNHKENSIFIYLLNGMANANEQTQFDSLMKKYASSKTAKTQLKHFKDIKRFDIFAGEKLDVFIPHLKNYFASIGLKNACYATWMFENKHLHIPDTILPLNIKGMNDYQAIEVKWSNSLLKENSVRTAEFCYDRYIQLNPKSSIFKKSRADYVSAKNKSSYTYSDLLSLIHMNDAAAIDFPKLPDFKLQAKTQRMRLISESSDSGDFKLTRRIWNEASTKYVDQKVNLEKLWRKMVEQDFRMNYFGSRVNAKGKNEAGVPEFSWNGVVDSCIAGKLAYDVMIRSEQRINYFRRMAGLSEDIVLSNQDNDYCMYAALMCEANRSMSHEPNDGWRCFIPAGLDALKNSILSKDGNPTIAITASMGQNHATVGNRRWLLYPKAQYMGIGTSRSYSVIKAIDNTRDLDSNKYKNQFVAWPPAMESPKMLLFKKWSFSIDRKLEGAVVTMKDASGNAVPLKQEAVVNGYGLNTLVWEPQINPTQLTDNSIFIVTIKLADGKTFTYKVILIDIALK